MGYTAIIGDQGACKTLFETCIVGQEALFPSSPNGIASNYDVDLSPLERLTKPQIRGKWWQWLGLRPPRLRGMDDFSSARVDLYRFRNDLRNLDLKRLHGRHIFFDDMQALFDCHYWETVPPHVRLFIVTHRHYQCQVTYSLPHWSQADKLLRVNTNRLIRVSRTGRWVFFKVYRIKCDEQDPTGSTVLMIAQHFWPKIIHLPFKPKDDMYPLRWKILRSIVEVVTGMYNTWAPIELDERQAEAGKKKHFGRSSHASPSTPQPSPPSTPSASPPPSTAKINAHRSRAAKKRAAVPTSTATAAGPPGVSTTA